MSDKEMRPANCRNRQRDEGKMYPRSGCDHCGNGGLMGCPFERANTAPPSAATVAQEGADERSAFIQKERAELYLLHTAHAKELGFWGIGVAMKELAALRAQLAERDEQLEMQQNENFLLRKAFNTELGINKSHCEKLAASEARVGVLGAANGEVVAALMRLLESDPLAAKASDEALREVVNDEKAGDRLREQAAATIQARAALSQPGKGEG